MPHPDGCPTISELHARYNGPIPKNLRAAANAGGWDRLAYNQVLANARFWHQYLRNNRLIRNHHVAMNAKRGFPPHPDQERMNAADLVFALRGLHHARDELRTARAQLAIRIPDRPQFAHGSCEGHPMPQPGMEDA